MNKTKKFGQNSQNYIIYKTNMLKSLKIISK